MIHMIQELFGQTLRPMVAIAVAIVAVLTGGFATAAFAERILKQDPPVGTLKAGKVVLVDDGSCGPGQIKKIIGGSNIGGAGPGTARQVMCIPHK
jgi:hypothetical protein